MRLPFLLIALLATFSWTGCAAVRPCPHRGSDPWRAITTEHFVVHTDLDSEQARKTALRLELYRKAMLLAASEELDPPARVQVILPRSDRYLAALTPVHEPYELTQSPTPWMVLTADSFGPDSKELPNYVAFRLAQLLTRSTLQRAPRWFTEGWAIYLQSAYFDPDLNHVEIGFPLNAIANTDHSTMGFLKSPRPLAELWAGEERPPLRDILVTYPWAYFLRYRHPERLAQLMDRWAQGEEPRLAWSRTFVGFTDAQLEAQAKSFLAPSQRYRYGSFPIPTVSASASERTLTDAEVHVLRARLELMMPEDWRDKAPPDRRARALAELAEALAAEPAHDEARLQGLLLSPGSIDTGEARQHLAARPRSAAAALVLALALDPAGNQAERLQAADAALALAPDHPVALSLLAQVHAAEGRERQAVEFAVRSARLAPWNVHAALVHAYVLARSGNCPSAVAAQRRARELLDVLDGEALASAVAARLKEYEQGCAQVRALDPLESGFQAQPVARTGRFR